MDAESSSGGSASRYPGQWYVERLDVVGQAWRCLLDSVGNWGYASGYFAAVRSFMPRPGYRLIDKFGRVKQEDGPAGPPRIN